MNSIKKTISILTRLSATASLAVDTDLPFSPVKAIYAGLAILLAAAEGAIDSHDALVNLLESIEHFLNRLDIYTQIPSTSVMDEMLAKIMVELISTLALATRELKQGRSIKFVKKGFGEKDVEAVLQRLDRLTQDEARTTAAETLKVVYSLVQNMTEVMNCGRVSIDGVLEALEILHKIASAKNQSKRDKLQRDIQRWLSPPDPWKNYNIAHESRYSGTGTWFVQGDMLLEWKDSGPSSLLWVHGKPGAGKSVLCSTIIQEIETMRKSGLASLAFYYHDFREDQKRDLRGLLSSVLFQLSAQSDSYHDILSALYSTHLNGTQNPSNSELLRCLKELLELPGQAPVFLIIDALDECPDTSAMPSPREEVLTLVEQLIDSRLRNLRLCVTSRPEIDIKLAFEPLAFRSISIHDERGQLEDIESYIRSVVNSDPKNRKWKQEDKQLVIDALTERANGMFRWVYCQLVYLRGCHPGRIRHALVELPKTLDETYERTLGEIKEADWELAHRLFQCVSVASRPLRVEELAEFLAFDFNVGPIPKFHEDWRSEDPLEAVLSTCSTLLSLVNDDRFYPSQFIQFSHFTVKEFLTSTRFAKKRDTVSGRYHVSLTPANALVAQACLGILLHLDESVTCDSLMKFPLADYAAKNWVGHARFEGVAEHAEEGMKQLFDPNKPHLAVWLWIYDPIMKSQTLTEMPWPPLGTPLHYAAFCGLHTVGEFLANKHLENMHHCILEADYGLTPLHFASEEGHEEIAHVLVKHGADVSARDKRGSTPLHLASRDGHLGLARFLVEHSADVTARDDIGQTPLYKASQNGHLDLARVLVEHGAEVTARDNMGQTPLYETLRTGRLDLVLFLVEHGADVTVRDNNGSTPLHLVGHLGLARFLIEHSADTRARDNDGLTPLHRASQSGCLDLARLLIEHGADATARDNRGSTPLHRVSKTLWGDMDLVKFLIEHGADLTARDDDGLTPAHRASLDGHLDFLRNLVELGADVTERDHTGSTPLHEASRNGRLDFSQFLVDVGADVTARDNVGSTPLREALRKGHLFLAQFLVEHGANVSARADDGSTPLHWVSQIPGETVDLARSLVDHGADVSARANDKSTPLHWVSQTSWGNVNFARFIVEHGADVTARGNIGSTPLHEVSRLGYPYFACFLLEHGADATARDDNGLTPLHCASQYSHDKGDSTLLCMPSQCWHVDVALLLVQHGADTTARANDGSTPLDLALQHDHVDLARFLVEHGADATAHAMPQIQSSNSGPHE